MLECPKRNVIYTEKTFAPHRSTSKPQPLRRSHVMQTLLFDAFGRTKFFSAALIEFHVLDEFREREGGRGDYNK